jgi:hypothetical protein
MYTLAVHSPHGYCGQCRPSWESAAQALTGPQSCPSRGEVGFCSSSHLWRWESTAHCWEIGMMPVYVEARDLVTILAEREECFSVFSPGWKTQGQIRKDCQLGF